MHEHRLSCLYSYFQIIFTDGPCWADVAPFDSGREEFILVRTLFESNIFLGIKWTHCGSSGSLVQPKNFDVLTDGVKIILAQIIALLPEFYSKSPNYHRLGRLSHLCPVCQLKRQVTVKSREHIYSTLENGTDMKVQWHQLHLQGTYMKFAFKETEFCLSFMAASKQAED